MTEQAVIRVRQTAVKVFVATDVDDLRSDYRAWADLLGEAELLSTELAAAGSNVYLKVLYTGGDV